MTPQTAAALRARARGQALAIVAIALPTLLLLALTVIELGERWHQVMSVEDALQQASRSAVQTLDYRALAENAAAFRSAPPQGCQRVTQAQPGQCRAVVEAAAAYLAANLQRARGLADGESVAALARRTRWTVLPRGGTCAYANGATRSAPAGTPLLCAEAEPVLRGVVGWGTFSPLITAGDTLDIATPAP